MRSRGAWSIQTVHWAKMNRVHGEHLNRRSPVGVVAGTGATPFDGPPVAVGIAPDPTVGVGALPAVGVAPDPGVGALLAVGFAADPGVGALLAVGFAADPAADVGAPLPDKAGVGALLGPLTLGTGWAVGAAVGVGVRPPVVCWDAGARGPDVFVVPAMSPSLE